MPWQWTRRMAPVALAAALSGCSALEGIYLPVENAPLQGPPPVVRDTRCDAPADPTPPQYVLENLKDCTSQDSLIVFAFSGGGIRSASFGYGVLGAAHVTKIPGTPEHNLDRDIDIVSGVSGGSFTAAAFASKRDALFPATPDAPDYYRDKFLTHDFFADLFSIYFAPWHWKWMFPDYGTNDEMAKVYAGIDFASPSDKLFDKSFGDLARKGRPLLVVQATDYGNEQPFTFTQNDFDLICSDIDSYPVGNAIAASSAFPILFSPIRLTNHHHDDPGPGDYCATHRPAWIDAVLGKPEPAGLSRLYTRARAAADYLPLPEEKRKNPIVNAFAAPRHVFLQDGGVSDNVALRGLTNIVVKDIDDTESGKLEWEKPAAAAACSIGLDKVRRILVVAVDGEAQPDNKIASLPYLRDLGLILNVTSSAAIDANGFETMLATDAFTRKIANKLEVLPCNGAAPAERKVASFFARVSFQDLAEGSRLAPAACGRKDGDCTLGDLARSGTSLAFSRPQVDALIDAGRSAFRCNRKIGEFLKDVHAAPPPGGTLACRTPEAKPKE
jgi:NTE family protein